MNGMKILAKCIKPFVSNGLDSTTQRRYRSKCVVKAIALLVRDLATAGPVAFFQGATLGPLAVLGTYSFSSTIMGTGTSFLSSLGSVALTMGSINLAFVAIPRTCTTIQEVSTHIKWLITPKRMSEKQREERACFYARCVLIGAGILGSAVVYNQGWLNSRVTISLL